MVGRPPAGYGQGGGVGMQSDAVGGASLADILSAVQNLVQATNINAKALNGGIPQETSGQLTANILVQTGFVRVTGISVTTAGAIGTLFDAANLAAAGAGNAVYIVPAAVGFISLNMVFKNGLVYKPGAAQVATIFFGRA